MPTYHNNQLTMVGLDSDEDEKSYAPAHVSPASNKRKRITSFDMSTSKDQEMSAQGAGGESAQTINSLYDGSGYGYVYDAPAPFAEWGVNPFGGLYDPLFGQSNLISHSSYEDVGGSFTPQPSYGSGVHDEASHDNNGLSDAPDATEPFPAYVDTMPEEAGSMHEAAYAVPDAAHAMYGAANIMSGVAVEEAQSAGHDTLVKEEPLDETLVSSTPAGNSDYSESDYDERRPSKVPKLNKDGIPRKPRQPRPKLLKWDDNDWKNVALGLVWACGENGIQIPFDQASQVVSESCTAGALQQALLKLRGKQIAEGFQIPSLRMAWTRKNKNATSSVSNANSSKSQDASSGTHKKNSTRFEGNQSKVVTLKYAYTGANRPHVAQPNTPGRASVLASMCERAPIASPLLPSPKHGYDIPVHYPTTPTRPRKAESGLPFTPATSPIRYQATLPASGTAFESGIMEDMAKDNAYFVSPLRGSNDLSSNRYVTLTKHDEEWSTTPPAKKVRFDASWGSPVSADQKAQGGRLRKAVKNVKRKLFTGSCDDKDAKFINKRKDRDDRDGHGPRYVEGSGSKYYPAAIFGGGIYPPM
jgi:hypothetical protein